MHWGVPTILYVVLLIFVLFQVPVLAEQQDECPNCSVNAACNSGTCVCNAGFEGDGITCDQNECNTGNNNCDVNANCTNTVESFVCTCTKGFVGNGVNCSDINECKSATTNKCSSNAACQNTPGSYSCICNGGWAGDGFTCADVDECALGTAACSENGTCYNQVGTYSCYCKPGYFGNGYFCYDTNECKNSATNNCSKAAICHNTAPGFYCTCQSGYVGDGYNCELDTAQSITSESSSGEGTGNAGVIIGCIVAAAICLAIAIVAFIKFKGQKKKSDNQPFNSMNGEGKERKVTFT